MPVSTPRTSTIARALFAAAFALFAFSCASAPAAIPDGLTPAELVQKAQDLYDLDQYDGAVRYYQAIRDRFPTDLASQCAADYEISFILYKQRKFDEAKAGFRALLKRYTTADAALLPNQYKVLGEKILAKIELQKTK